MKASCSRSAAYRAPAAPHRRPGSSAHPPDAVAHGRASEPTAAITATPSNRQARKMRKPFSPPRSSRRASVAARRQLPAVSATPVKRRHCGCGHHADGPCGRSARQHGIVGDQQQRGAAARAQREHQVDDVAAGLAVEIAGRLVGQQQPRRDDEGAGQRHPLLLAAGELAGIVGRGDGRARRTPSSRRRVAEGVAAPASSSGTATFSSAVMVGIRWKSWNTMPTRSRRNSASPSSSSAVEILAGDRDSPGARPLQPGDHHHHRRLAGAGRADDADRLAGRHARSRPRRMLTSPAALSSFRWMSSRRTIQPSASVSSHGGHGHHRIPVGAGSRTVRCAFLWAYGLPAVCVNAMAALAFLSTAGPAQAGTQPIRILAFGDSITAGYGLSDSDSLPVQLEAALQAHGIDATVINGGVSGDTSRRRAGAARLGAGRRSRHCHRRSRRQRRSARHRSQDPGESRRHPQAPDR